MAEEEFRMLLDVNLGHDMAYYEYLTNIRGVQRIMSGSDLEDDNNNYSSEQRHLSPVWLAWRSIAGASEHAGFAEHMRYVTTGGVVDRPQSSLARATLLGAARAIYLLAPDDAKERAIRAARLANAESEDAARMIKNVNSQLDPDEFIGNLEKYSSEIATAATRVLKSSGENPKSKISETELICSAIREMPQAPPDSIEQALTLWNRASGVAHARSWIWDLSGGIVPRNDFIGTWHIPVVMLCRAWHLWNLRRGEPSFPQQAPRLWEPERYRWGKLPRRKSWKKLIVPSKNALAIAIHGLVARTLPGQQERE